jgi:hypothetical protein
MSRPTVDYIPRHSKYVGDPRPLPASDPWSWTSATMLVRTIGDAW